MNNAPYILEALEKFGVDDVILTAQAFQEQTLSQQIQKQAFNVMHLATHGNLSSNPDETYILDWEGRLDPQVISEMIRSTNLESALSASAVEMLVLSVCETAEGDERASLGLAGVAVPACARSTVSPLWQVNDVSTAAFIEPIWDLF